MRKYSIKFRIQWCRRDWWIGFKLYQRSWNGPILTIGLLFCYIGIFWDRKEVLYMDCDTPYEELSKFQKRRHERIKGRGWEIHYPPTEQRCIICSEWFKIGSTERELMCSKPECQGKPYDYILVTPETILQEGDMLHLKHGYGPNYWWDLIVSKEDIERGSIMVGHNDFVTISGPYVNDFSREVYLMKAKPQHWFYEHNPDKIPKFKKDVEFPKFGGDSTE